jgi:hypothetical protein
MALVEEQLAAPGAEIIALDITGAKIIDPKIVDGRIVGGRIVDGRVDSRVAEKDEETDRKTRRARHLHAESMRTQVIAFLGAGLALLLILLL